MQSTVVETVMQITQPPSLKHLLAVFLAVGVTFSVLERLRPAMRRCPIRPGMAVDVAYWLFTPIVTKSITSLMLVCAAFVMYLMLGWPLTAAALDGFGPLRRQPLWLQAFEMLIMADFIGYWIHRGFHYGWFWKIHAVHHSPRQLDWLSAYRMHPLNDAGSRVAQTLPLLAVGFSPLVLIPYVPFIVIYVVFLHANIRCSFGPLKYALVSPSYHRWHHTSDEEGLDCNFATMFPIWDILFGTVHMPNREPVGFGVKDDAAPEGFVGQMLHPFGWKNPAAAADRSGGVESFTNGPTACRALLPTRS